MSRFRTSHHSCVAVLEGRSHGGSVAAPVRGCISLGAQRFTSVRLALDGVTAQKIREPFATKLPIPGDSLQILGRSEFAGYLLRYRGLWNQDRPGQ